jgi:protoporphyrinogen oxidase
VSAVALPLLPRRGLDRKNSLSKIAVIGAGPAGITAAYQLAKAGVPVHVYEASNSVGGLAKTLELWNQRVDLGPHRFFSNDKRVNDLWLEVVGDDYEMVNRLTRIYYNGRFFHYPLKPFDALSKLGVAEAFRCLASYGLGRLKRAQEEESFEGWVTQRFGRRLFDIFFKTYSEKLWGISCRDLDSDFAAQRIKKLSLGEAIKNAFARPKQAEHATLADQFAYPHQGTGEIYERMASYVRSHGGTVECGRPVQRVLMGAGRVSGIELADGEIRNFDHVISTMPLNLLVTRLPDVPAEIAQAAHSLKFRNTILAFLKVEASDLFPDNWLYVHAPELRVGRITNFRNWVPQLHGEEKASILALEYWCDLGDALWSESNDSIIQMASEEMGQTGLLKGASVSAGYIHRIPRCYPVYNRGYRKNLGPIEKYLQTIDGLTAIGRDGAFKYNNQDHSILMGILTAENIISHTRHDLWSINTDYETYQESSMITKTGLVPRPGSGVFLPQPAPSAALQRA